MEHWQELTRPESWMAALDVLIKLAIGVVLAGAVGVERSASGKPAGLRTHILLAVGVVLFSELSRGLAVGDQTRIAAQVVTGIGFLCAGAIMRDGGDVKGLTTAASLWAIAGISMAVSAGGVYMIVAVASTLLSLFTLAVLRRFEEEVIEDDEPA